MKIKTNDIKNDHCIKQKKELKIEIKELNNRISFFGQYNFQLGEN